jgi:fatty acid desaturase
MAIKLRPVIIKGKGLLEISKEIESMVGELAKPSGAQTLKALSFDYSLLFSTIFLFHWARSSGNFTLLELMVIGFLCLFPLGAAAHGIGVIGHDNAHRISFKNLKVNDHAGRWLISYPLIVFSVDRFWKVHKQHHLGLNSDNDPDYISSMSSKSFHFPMSRGRYAWVLFKTFFFGGLIHYSGTSDAAKQKREEKVTLGYKVGLAFYWVSVVAVVAYFGLFWELGLWVLSLLTAAMLFIKIRMDV